MAAFQTTCPGCNAMYKVEDSHLGRSARCAKCGARFKITTVSSGAAPSAPTKQSASKVPSAAAARPSEEANVPAQWNVGDVILDLYEVTGVLGEGGMGKVYKVHHRGWNMDLAVKCPKPDFFHTDRQKENFVAECETWIKLGLHPHIVSCHYVRTLGGIPRVFAECVEGGNLKQWIESGKLYEGGPEKALERILDIAIQFAWGLHYAHEHEEGLIHQDVKPANVMMTPDGIAKVTDFGLARARAAAGEVSTGDRQQSVLVSSGGMTPTYCSPEQANKERLSRKTDIWSWGVSILEMFTGDVTWMSGVAAMEALEAYLEMCAEDESIPEMPDPLAELLRQCFQRNPAGRPKDMQEIADSLREIHREAMGEEYPREEPKAAELLANGLNNHAVSLHDLGRQEEADELFEEALRLDSDHLQAIFNKGYSCWRRGHIAGDALVAQMKKLEQSHGSDEEYWRCLAWIHLEQGDLDVVQALQQSAHSVKEPRFLEAMEDDTRPVGKLEHTIECKDRILSVDYSPDCRYVVLGTNCGTLFLLDVTTPNRQSVFDGYFQLFEGHTFYVPSVRFSPNGRYIVSGGHDRTVRLWEVPTSQGWRRFGKQLQLFKGHRDCVTSVALSPDGRFVFSGSRDSTVRMWDSVTGKEVRRFEGHEWAVTSVCISADGRYLLSGSEDHSVRLWCVADGKQQRPLVGHTHPVHAVAFSPDGSQVASASADRTVRLWKTGTGEVLRVLRGHTSEVNCVCFSPDGIHVLSGSGRDIDVSEEVRDNSLRLWEAASGRELRRFDNQGKVSSVCFSADGERAASASPDNKLRLWAMYYRRKSWGGSHPYPLLCRVREVAHLDSEMRRLDAYLRLAREHIDQGRPPQAYSVLRKAQTVPGYEQDDRVLRLLTQAGAKGRGTRRGIRKAWRIRSLNAHEDLVTAVAFSPDNRCALSAGHDRTIRIWDIEGWNEAGRLQGHSESVTAAGFSTDGRFVVSGSQDQTIRVWEVESGAQLVCFRGHTAVVNAVCFSPDGTSVISGSSDATVRLWDAKSGQEVARLVSSRSQMRSLCFSPEGSRIVAGSGSAMRIVAVANGEDLGLLETSCQGTITSVCYSPDGRSILSASTNNVFHMWSADTGEEQRQFSGHKHGVACAMYSPDGRYVVSGSFDRTVCLWDITEAQLLVQLEEHSGPVYSVCFSPDGRFVMSGSADRTIGVWEIDWEWDF